MPNRFVHRLLLQSRRALPSIRRSFSNTLSSSSGDPNVLVAGSRSRDEYIQSLVSSSRFPRLAEYWKTRIRLEKRGIPNGDPNVVIQIVTQKVGEEMDKHMRSIELLTDLECEIIGRDDQSAQIRQQLSAAREEHWKIYLDWRWHDGYKNCKTVDDWEKWGDECVEKLREMNESISQINAVAKRIIASPPPPPPEKEEMAEHSRLMRLSIDLMEEINGRDDDLDLDQIRQLSAMIDEHLKLSSAFEDGETEEDWEKWGDERLEILREMDESISEIKDVVKRIIASSPPPPEKEKEENVTVGYWTLLFFLVVIPATAMYLD